MNPYLNHQVKVRFKTIGVGPTSFDFHLRLVQQFLRSVVRFDPLLKETEWLLATGVRETSYLHSVFNASGPTPAVLEFLNEECEKDAVVKSLSLWNGQEDRAKGATIVCMFDRDDGRANIFKLSIRSPREHMRLGGWTQVAEALACAVKVFDPIIGSVGTMHYDAVFKDRPGVGWMLYLPRTLTERGVPEARAWVPVMGTEVKGKSKQLGTILVSVTDAPFSETNPEHMRIANAIEVRLVDQDLLPRYADL